MVSSLHRDRTDLLLVFTQCGCMDEKQAVYEPRDVTLLYRYHCPGAAILGDRDLRQLCLLQQYQSHCVRKD